MVEAEFEIAWTTSKFAFGGFSFLHIWRSISYLLALPLIFGFFRRFTDVQKATSGLILGGAIFTQGLVYVDEL